MIIILYHDILYSCIFIARACIHRRVQLALASVNDVVDRAAEYIPETARRHAWRRRRSRYLIGGARPAARASRWRVFIIHPSCLRACVVRCRRRRRSQWKRLARRPLTWPCKVSGARSRLMKTLYYYYYYHYTG